MEQQQQYPLTPEQVISSEQLARQKEYKATKERFRAAIKYFYLNQVLAKAHRKTVNFKNKSIRKWTPYQATALVEVNRNDIRHLHIAYAIFRNKVIPEVYYTFISTAKGTIVRKDGKAIKSTENAPNIDYINKLLKEYGPKSKTVHLGEK